MVPFFDMHHLDSAWSQLTASLRQLHSSLSVYMIHLFLRITSGLEGLEGRLK